MDYYHRSASMKPAKQDRRIWFITTRQPPERIKVHWYRWEFLRRNSEYRADYAAFMNRFGPWFQERCFWYERYCLPAMWTARDHAYFARKIYPVIGELCRKWQVGNLFPPGWKFDRRNGARRFRKDKLYLPTGVAPELNWDPGYTRFLLENHFTGLGGSVWRFSQHLLIEFDLTWPLKDMLRFANQALRRGKGSYDDELGDQGRPPDRTRRRFEDYDQHLRIWDLANQGKNVAEIVRFEFPHERPDSAMQKVRDHLKTADKLVSGRYQEIR
jgi:hypothetical protein